MLELLAATLLGGLVITAALTMYQTIRERGERLFDDARIERDGRLALDLLRAYGRLAGYRIVPETDGRGRAGTALEGCSEASRAGIADCPIRLKGTDALKVRYRADAVSAWRGNQGRTPADCAGTLLPANRLAGNGGAVVQAFFSIRQDRRYGLRRLHCSSQGRTTDPLIENIDHLSIRYWLSGTTALRPAARMKVTDWQHVRGFEACVLVRGSIRKRRDDRGFTDCTGRRQAALPDGLTRRTFVATVAIRNIAWPGL